MKLFYTETKDEHKIYNFMGIKFKVRTNKKMENYLYYSHYMCQFYNYQLANKIKENILKEKVRRGEKVKVFFLMAQPSKFGMETIYSEMQKTSIFEPYIYSVYYDKNDNLDKNFQKQCEKNYNYWKNKGYNVICGYDKNFKSIPLYEYNPDIVFLTDPVMGNFSHFKNDIINYNYLTCYVPYGMNIVKDFRYHYNWMTIAEMWKVFAPTYYDYEMFINKSSYRGINVVSYGYPKLDSYSTPIRKSAIPQKINNGNPIIVYAPHWSIKEIGTNNIATFHLYYKYFLNLVKTHKDLNFVFKPHPRLLPRLYDLINDPTVILPSEYLQYIDEWNSCENGIVIEEEDYTELFKNSSALITDCGSFIGEYLFSKQPCIYLVNQDMYHFGRKLSNYREKYNDFANTILDSYYICENLEEIESTFNEVVINKIDTKKEERLKLIEKYSENVGCSGQKIVEHLIKTIKN